MELNDLEKVIEEAQKKEQEEWGRKTPQEKIDCYRKQPLYSKYCDMSVEELEKEKEFNKEMANKLWNSKFGDPFYSAYGCDENVRRINTILKLKKQ